MGWLCYKASVFVFLFYQKVSHVAAYQCTVGESALHADDGFLCLLKKLSLVYIEIGLVKKFRTLLWIQVHFIGSVRCGMNFSGYWLENKEIRQISKYIYIYPMPSNAKINSESHWSINRALISAKSTYLERDNFEKSALNVFVQTY
jgi:hypothetical protein